MRSPDALRSRTKLARIRERLASGAGRGHRTVPHTADLRIEAWAPTREECLAEAVRGLVDSFAVVAPQPPQGLGQAPSDGAVG